jgi:hypothetical protein
LVFSATLKSSFGIKRVNKFSEQPILSTGHDPEPVPSQTYLPEIHLNVIPLLLLLVFQKGFLTKLLYTPLLAFVLHVMPTPIPYNILKKKQRLLQTKSFNKLFFFPEM